MILFVRYRNHFPVVQFQNQAHIRNPHGTGQVLKTIWGATGAPNFFFFFGGLPKAVPQAPLPRRAREIPPKAGVLRISEGIICNLYYLDVLLGNLNLIINIKRREKTNIIIFISLSTLYKAFESHAPIFSKCNNTSEIKIFN